LGQRRLGAMTADLWSHRQCPVSDGFATRIGSADKAKLIQAKNMQFTLWVMNRPSSLCVGMSGKRQCADIQHRVQARLLIAIGFGNAAQEAAREAR
jgi:hypothetical protein